MSKLLSTHIAKRLEPFLESMEVIPPEQHGKSTLSDCRVLKEKIESCTGTAFGGPLYALLVDYTAAFNLASRTKIVEKLAAAGVAEKMLQLIVQVLQEGEVTIEDGVGRLPSFVQKTGVAQGDTLKVSLIPAESNENARGILQRERHDNQRSKDQSAEIRVRWSPYNGRHLHSVR